MILPEWITLIVKSHHIQCVPYTSIKPKRALGLRH
ncbi:hypothetical protein X975_24665, partial [Stegodyphus mimosarum]